MKSLLLPLFSGLMFVAAMTPGAPKTGRSIELDAIIRPSRIVRVGAATDGLLDSVLVDRGDFVQAGQLVAELDQRVERAAAALARARARQVAKLRSAEVKLGHLEERLENHQDLFEDGILSSENLGQSQLERHLAELDLLEASEQAEIAKHEYERARAVVDRGRITSPVAGAVIERALSPGEIVGRSGESTIVTIAQLDPLIVEAFAPIALLGKVGPDTRAEVVIENPRQVVQTAVVKTVSPIVDAASGTFSIRLELDNPDFRIPAGLRCRIRFTK